MAGFGDGLMQGFSFIEGINNMRERRRIADEELGLRRAANARAETAFQTQQDVIADTRLRQQMTDRSNVVLAGAQRKGFENLNDGELAELNELAPYNPAIAAGLTDAHNQQRDLDAIRGLGSLTNRPQGLAAAAQPTAAPTPGPTDGSMTPFDVVTQGAGAPLPGEQAAGLRTVHHTYLQGLVPGYTPDQSMIDPKRGTVDLPPEMIDELEKAKDLPVVQRQAVIDKYRAQLGDPAAFSAGIASQRAAAASVKDDIASYRSFLDPKDEHGADLRRLASENPSAFAAEFANDYNTLKRDDPNTLAVLNREMQPVVAKALMETSSVVRSLPHDASGNIPNDARTRAAMSGFNRIMTLQQNMSDEFKPDLQASIRRGAMPVGNAELAGQVRQIVESTPPPATPATGDQLRANMTIAQRAAASVASGTRNLTTKQVESLAWLTKRNYITPDGFEQFLTTGTFQKPADAKFISHDPDNYLFGPNGEILYTPPNPKPNPGDISGWSDDVQGVVDDYFEPPPGATAEQADDARRQRNSFYVMLSQHPRELFQAGINVNDMRQWSRGDAAFALARFQGLQDTKSAYDNHWWYGDKLTQLFNGSADEKGWDITNYDTAATKFLDPGDRPPPPPGVNITDGHISAARMRLAAQGGLEGLITATIATPEEIQQMILQDIEAQNPPAPLVTKK